MLKFKHLMKMHRENLSLIYLYFLRSVNILTMEFEIYFDIHQKRQRTVFNKNACIFCGQLFTKSSRVTADAGKLESLFSACRERLHDVGKQSLEHEQDIKDGKINFSYHKNCRVTYCSKMYLKRIAEKRESSSSKSDGSYGDERRGNQSGSRITRSSFNGAISDWKTKCFIRSNKCSVKHRSTWSMVESSVDLSNHSMFSKVMKAAN